MIKWLKIFINRFKKKDLFEELLEDTRSETNRGEEMYDKEIVDWFWNDNIDDNRNAIFNFKRKGL